MRIFIKDWRVEGYVWNVKDWLNFEIIEVEEWQVDQDDQFIQIKIFLLAGICSSYYLLSIFFTFDFHHYLTLFSVKKFH